jgi:beta-glucosidase
MRGRSYRYLAVEPLFPFGFGLSYTRFRYSELALSCAELDASEELRLEVSVLLTNAGARASDEVVQLYVKDLESSVPVPHHELRGIQRVHLAAGVVERVTFSLGAKSLSLIDNDGKRWLEPGRFRIFVGGSQPDARSAALLGQAPLAADVVVTGVPLALPY